MAVWFK